MDASDADKESRLRQAYEMFSRGAYDAVLELGVHPEVEYVPALGHSPVRGVENLRAWMEPDAFDLQIVEPVEIEINGNRALVHQRGRMRGAGSGIEMEVDSWAVWTLDDDGLLIRLENFMFRDEAEARRAAGLGD